MKSIITKVPATFILSQMMPITMILTLPDTSAIDAYKGGLVFDIALAGLLFVLYGIIFLDTWTPSYVVRIGGTQAKVLAVYAVLIALAYQFIPSLLTITVYFSPAIRTTCMSAYEFGWLVDILITLLAFDIYFTEWLSHRPEYYSR